MQGERSGERVAVDCVVALEKQVVQLPVAGGLREDVAPNLLEPPYAAELENCEFDKEGIVNKAPGARALTTTGVPGGLVPNGIFTHGDVLCQNTYNKGTQVLSEDHGRWATPHELAIRPAEIKCSTFMAGQDSILYTDVAITNGFACFVWQQGNKAVVLCKELDTDAVCFGPREIDSTLTHATNPRPRVVAIGTSFVIAFNSVTSGVRLCRIPTATLPFALSSTTLLSGAASDALKDFDCQASQTSAYLVMDVGGATTRVHRVKDGNPPTSDAQQDIPQAPAAAAVLHAVADTVVLVAIGADSATNTVRMYSLSEALGAETVGAVYNSTWTPGGTPPVTRVRVTIGVQGASDSYAVVWSLSGEASSGAAEYTAGIRSVTEYRIVDSAAADVPGNLDELNNYVLVSRAFMGATEGSGAMFCVAWDWGDSSITRGTSEGTDARSQDTASTLQPVGHVVELVDYTTFVEGVSTTRTGYAVIGRYHVDKARGFDVADGNSPVGLDDGTAARTDNYVSHVAKRSTDGLWWMAREYIFDRRGAKPEHAGGATGLGNFHPLRYVGGLVQIDVTPRPLRAVQADNAPSLQGGICGYFDGVQSFEMAPHVRPEKPYMAANTGAASVDLLLRYRVVFIWEDALGNLHRSAPSLPSRKVGLDATDDSVTLKYSLPPVTALAEKLGRRVLVEIYRTRNLVGSAAELYFRIFRGTPTVDGTDQCSGTYTDAVADVDQDPAQYGPPLYTDGGELEAEAPPALLDICAHGNRLFGISGDNPSIVWFTKLIQQNIAPEWNGLLTIRVASEGGEECTALASLDEKLICFKKRQVYYVVGDGPNNLGGGAPFPEPQPIVGAPGCDNRASVVTCPAGVIYQGDGPNIYLIDRALQVTYIGGPVEDTLAVHAANGGTIVGAVHLQKRRQVRFLLKQYTIGETTTGIVLVFDYERKQWAKWTDRYGVAACLWLGLFAWMRNTYAGRVEDSTVYTVPDGTNRMRITTPWIKPAGLAGFARLWRTQVRGSYSSGDFELRAQYNHIASGGDTRSWTAAEIGALASFDLELHHATQKIQAVQYRMTETGTTSGAGFTIDGLRLVCGIKPAGRYKALAPAARK